MKINSIVLSFFYLITITTSLVPNIRSIPKDSIPKPHKSRFSHNIYYSETDNQIPHNKLLQETSFIDNNINKIPSQVDNNSNKLIETIPQSIQSQTYQSQSIQSHDNQSYNNRPYSVKSQNLESKQANLPTYLEVGDLDLTQLMRLNSLIQDNNSIKL